MKILIVEDEPKTAAYLNRGLSENGFTVQVAGNGEAGLAAARTGLFDLVLLDVMLPVRSGWSVVETLRKEGILTPVLLLTARDTVPDRVKGLELGADDYLVKPFAFSELLARVRGPAAAQRQAVPGAPGGRRPGAGPGAQRRPPRRPQPGAHPPGIPAAVPVRAAPGRGAAPAPSSPSRCGA